jgi:hypothetical protein
MSLKVDINDDPLKLEERHQWLENLGKDQQGRRQPKWQASKLVHCTLPHEPKVPMMFLLNWSMKICVF